jgi:5'-nucleotidase
VVVAPEAPSGASAADQLSYGAQLQLRRRPDLGGGAWSLRGATPADCILCAADQKAGLLRQLQLSPVLAVVGIGRGPALSSGVDSSPTVAAARQAAILGLPSIAACLASTSPQAPLEPAAEAAGLLLERAARVLQAQRGWPRATNMPRAHFPFPTRGRWALGRELALPAGVGVGEGGAGGGLEEPADCWALGDDGSWLGGRPRCRCCAPTQLLLLWPKAAAAGAAA